MLVIEHSPAPDAAPRGASRQAGLVERCLQRPGTARLVLLLSLVITALAWLAARHHAQDDARQRFERRTDDIQSRIGHRMASYEAMLRGGVALLSAHPDTTRSQWRDYVQTVRPEQQVPGIQGFGVSRWIPAGDLTSHERAVQGEGFANYRVRPEGPREAYSAIVYLEPFEARNLRAFGFDMMSEPTRREAMLRARDTGAAAASGIVTLVQEDGQDVQQGFLMYLPVYRSDVADASRLWGWVYAPFRVRDLMAGLLDEHPGTIHFRIHDGPLADDARQAFYRSDDDRPPAAEPDFVTRRSLSFGGRTWNLVYEGRQFQTAGDTWQTHLVALLGLTVDLVLYGSIAALARRKRQFENEVALRSAEVRARAAWLDAVAGLSPDGTLVFERRPDGAYRLVFTNPAFSQWFGLRPDDLLGLTEEATDEWLQGLAQEEEAMPPLRDGPAQIVLAGPPRRVLQRGVREGERHRVYYFHDVTHQTEVENLKNEFLTTAAHELRTPLAGVYGFAELLQDDRLDAARSRRALDIIYRQAGVLKHLVDELLDLARIDSRRSRDFQFERLDLRRLAELAAEPLNRPGTVSRLHLVMPPEPVWVDGDATRLRQAIANVLSNAMKFSSPPAAVSLSIEILGAEHERDAVLRVVDAGIGMTAEQCERAFERFYRADPSGNILGAGLGLSIVKEVVELHRGSVALHSTPGAGTQVTLRLPSRPAPARTPDARDDAPAEAEASSA